MKRVALAATLVAALFLSGCATVTVERAKGVAETGKAYTDALQKVGDLSVDRSISFSADFLATIAPRTDSAIDIETDAMRKRVKMVADANLYLEAIGNYFKELDALASGDQSADTVAATGKLADALKREPIGLSLSADKKAAITGLAGFVSKQVHAAVVQSVLQRDADTVAQALALCDEILVQEAKWVEYRAELQRQKDYLEQVKKPFLANAKLSDTWKSDWTASVKQSTTIATIEEARKASRAMLEAWKGILRGSYSFDEVKASLDNVKAGVAALQALKSAK